MTGIYIVGEDPVTLTIARRLISEYTQNLHVIGHLPARGSQVKNKEKLTSFNTIAETTPVVLLLDLDAENCPPEFKNRLLQNLQKSDNFVVNIACDEAESWLMADLEGFSRHFHIPSQYIPLSKNKSLNGPRRHPEVIAPYKTSMYLTHEIAKHSTLQDIRSCLYVDNPDEKCKSSEYNSVILPYIETVWNIENARKGSYSLSRMIERIQELDSKYKEGNNEIISKSL